MRFWYDCADDRARQRLASTLFFFLLATNGLLLAAAVAISPWLSVWLGAAGYTLALQLVLLNTFAIGFTFIPFHVLRMQQRAREFSLLAFARSASTLVLRLAARRRLRLRRNGRRRRGSRGHGGLDGGDGAVVRPAHPAGVLVRRAARVARVRSAARPARLRAAGDRGRRQDHPDVLRLAARDRALRDGRQRRPHPEGLSRGVRVRVGALLLRDGQGARRRARLQRGHDLRRGDSRADDGGALGHRRRSAHRRHARTIHGRRWGRRLDVARRVLPGRLPDDVDRAEHHAADGVLSGRDGYLGRA